MFTYGNFGGKFAWHHHFGEPPSSPPCRRVKRARCCPAMRAAPGGTRGRRGRGKIISNEKKEEKGRKTGSPESPDMTQRFYPRPGSSSAPPAAGPSAGAAPDLFGTAARKAPPAPAPGRPQLPAALQNSPVPPEPCKAPRSPRRAQPCPAPLPPPAPASPPGPLYLRFFFFFF